TGDVGAFADVHEQRVAVDGERFKARQSARLGNIRDDSRLVLGHGFGNGLDMRRGRATAAANDVEETASGELLDDYRHFLGAFIVFTERIRSEERRVGKEGRGGRLAGVR